MRVARWTKVVGFLALLLTLSACGGLNAPTAISGGHLQGRIENGSGSANKLYAIGYSTIDADNPKLLATTDIRTDGSFSINLGTPGENDLVSISSFLDGLNLKTDNDDAKLYGAFLFAAQGSSFYALFLASKDPKDLKSFRPGDTLSPILKPGEMTPLVSIVYADQKVTLTGAYYDIEFNATLEKGWNILLATKTEDGWNVTAKNRIPPDLRWFIFYTSD